jgi:argininosuccinate lyase
MNDSILIPTIKDSLKTVDKLSKHQKISFRESYRLVKAMYQVSIERNESAVDTAVRWFGPAVKEVFDLKKAMLRKDVVIGAPGTKNVKKQINKWKYILARKLADLDKYADVRRRFFEPKKVTFREAHYLIGEIVSLAEEERISIDEFVRRFISEEVANEVFDLKKAMAKRNLIDIPGTKVTKNKLKIWNHILSDKKLPKRNYVIKKKYYKG